MVSKLDRVWLLFALVETLACGGGQSGAPGTGGYTGAGGTVARGGGGGAAVGTGGSPGLGGGFTVTYDPNGAPGGVAAVDATRYGQGQTVTVLANSGTLVYPGYTLVGWQTKADGSGIAYAPGDTFPMGAADVTLYALWAGGYAYAVNHNDGAEGAISQFVIGPNGALTPMPKPTVDAGGADTRYVAVDPLGRYLYATNVAANGQAGTLSQFTIDQTNGALSPMSPLVVSLPTSAPATQAGPAAAAIHPTGPWLYLVNQQSGVGPAVTQFTIDVTGKLTSPALLQVGKGESPYGIAIDPTGQYAYVAANCCGGTSSGSVFEYKVDPTTGALQPIGSVATVAGSGWALPWDIKAIRMPSGSEYVYVSNYDDGTVWAFAINPADGTLSLVSSLLAAPTDTVCTCDKGAGNNIAAMGIALHPSGKFAYVTFSCCSSKQAVAQFNIDQGSGVLSPMAVPTVLASGSSQSIAIESSGKYAYVTSGETGFANSAIAQYTIDQTTGVLSLMGNPTVQTQGVGPSGIVTVGQ